MSFNQPPRCPPPMTRPEPECDKPKCKRCGDQGYITTYDCVNGYSLPSGEPCPDCHCKSVFSRAKYVFQWYDCHTALKEAREEIKRLENTFKHVHEARYEDGKLTDICNACGLDLRENVHRSDTP